MKRKKHIFILSAVLLVTAVAVLYAVRPDLRFLTVQTLTSSVQRIRMEETVIPEKSLRTISLQEIERENSVTYNQSLLLVNAEHPLPDKFSPALTDCKNTDYQLNDCAAMQFEALAAAVLYETEEPLFITSAARTRSEQVDIKKQNPDTAADAGESEHETGLAIDVCTNGFAGSAFLKSKAGQFVYEYGWRYGFVVRYPLGKTNVTGIPFEPWHIRYVGYPHAYILHQNGWTLEEYIEKLEPGKFYSICGYCVSRQKGPTFRVPEKAEKCSISSDNTGHYIITYRIAA